MNKLSRRIIQAAGIGLAMVICAGSAYFVTNFPDRDLRGVWRSDGYGLVIDISLTRMNIYEVSTPNSCLHWTTLLANLDLVERLAGYQFSSHGDALKIDVIAISNDVDATRIDALPDTCTAAQDDSPQATLDVFLSTFARHYPNFAIYGVDWDTRSTNARAALADGTALDQILRESLDDLHDGHVHITFDTEEFEAKPGPEWSYDRRAIFDTSATYLNSPLIEQQDAGLYHGWLKNNVGYIAIVHMSPEGPIWQQPMPHAQKLTHALAKEYADAKAMIIDLRFNSGGSDTVALTYASLISDTPWVVGRKSIQIAPDQFDPWVTIIAPGMDTALDVPTAVLVSSYTVSAAEVGLMALRELPQVTLIGENSAGAISNKMDRQLPNGWAFGLPHQRFETPDGTSFEGPGVPPDINVDMNIGAFALGQDAILETAIAHPER